MLTDDTRQSNLPARRSSLIGRERELSTIKAHLLDHGSRLLTLTGAGGSGKTTLALEAARSLLDEFPDGAWLIRLDPVLDPSAVAWSACSALGLSDQPGASPVEVLVDFLALRDALLVLDNCEHLVESVAELVDDLLSACPNLRVLATSRMPLALSDEVVFAVPPLRGPDVGTDVGTVDLPQLEASPAVELFVTRAAAARSGFALSVDNAGAVARICRALDGLPLAIELAAARVRLLSCAEIAERLEGDIHLLRSNVASGGARHRTLEATLDWSYALLPEHQQRLFRRLGVFSSGWNSRSLESICGRLDDSSDSVLEDLEQLIDHSLVVAEPGRAGMRYRLLEPVRVYSLDLLREAGEIDRVRDAHTTHYMRYAAILTAAATVTHSDAPGLDRLAEEYDNIARAGEWARQRGDATSALGACAALLEFDRVRGHLRAGLRRMEAALALPADEEPRLRASVMMSAADYARLLGDYDCAAKLAGEGERIFARIGYQGGVSLARAILGDVAADNGEFERARALYDEAFSLLDPDADEDLPARSTEHRGRAWWYSNVGIIAFRQRNLLEAEHLLDEGARRMRQVGGWYYGRVLMYQARVAFAHGNGARAAGLVRQAVAWLQPYRAAAETAEGLELMAEIVLAERLATRAATLLGAASVLREMTGARPHAEARERIDALTERARDQLGLTAFTDAWSAGRALPYDAAVSLACEEHSRDGEAKTRKGAAGSLALTMLTRREREVAELVAQGLTNREIAARLIVSEGTARTHVERILRKLGVHSRVQVATLVAERAPLDT